MTGYRSGFFRYVCDQQGCYIEGLPSWDDLIECFPRRIRPTDIDGLVEMGGNFLFLEEKRAGVAPDEGQRRALVRLSKQPRTTVVLMRPGATSDLEVLLLEAGQGSGWLPYTRDEFKAWLRAWCRRADLEPVAS